MKTDEVWSKIKQNEGIEIELSNKVKFTYKVTGDSIFIDDNNWMITKSEVTAAVNCKRSNGDNDCLSYIYAILNKAGV